MAEEAENVDVREETGKSAEKGAESVSGHVQGEIPSNSAGFNANGAGAREGYEWDPVRQGYFPKIDDDFLAYYQASYGFVEEDGVVKPAPALSLAAMTASQLVPQPAMPTAMDDEDSPTGQDPSSEKANATSTSEASTEPISAPDATDGGDAAKLAQAKKRKAADPAWFEMEETKNNNVYVSGLPLGYSEQDFYDLMSKCGIVKDDEDSEEPKIKLYRTKDGEVKGDGLCCYLKHESIALAVQILDGSMLDSNRISVQPAVFERKGEFNPTVRKKKKPKKKNTKSAQEKLLGWNEPKKGPGKRKTERIVIFHHCFDPKEFDEDALLINEIRDEMKAECEKCGPVHKVVVFDRHPQGVLSVAFKEFESAEKCVEAMNGRWYGGRKLEVAIYDGVTSYQIEETDLERADRLKNWEKYISTDKADGAKGSEASGSDAKAEETKQTVEGSEASGSDAKAEETKQTAEAEKSSSATEAS